ncbi:glycoside hydrolase family 2 protein [Rhodococcus sp. C26F]
MDSTGAVLAESVHFVGGPARPVERGIGLAATARPVPGGWSVEVRTEGAAQYVHFDVTGGDLQDSWFHLPPGGSRTLAVRACDPAATLSGRVGASNSATSAPIRVLPASDVREVDG